MIKALFSSLAVLVFVSGSADNWFDFLLFDYEKNDLDTLSMAVAGPPAEDMGEPASSSSASNLSVGTTKYGQRYYQTMKILEETVRNNWFELDAKLVYEKFVELLKLEHPDIGAMTFAKFYEKAKAVRIHDAHSDFPAPAFAGEKPMKIAIQSFESSGSSSIPEKKRRKTSRIGPTKDDNVEFFVADDSNGPTELTEVVNKRKTRPLINAGQRYLQSMKLLEETVKNNWFELDAKSVYEKFVNQLKLEHPDMGAMCFQSFAKKARAVRIDEVNADVSPPAFTDKRFSAAAASND